MTFKTLNQVQANQARIGKLKLNHGTVDTPAFMPVGTRATVKALSSEDLLDLDAQIILGNTYHLMLRPGMETMREMGGLHSFMNWERPILTDSGGFQIFSLNSLSKITDEGVTFSSHIDGSKHFMGPKECMDIQASIGSDIRMVLDECPALPATKETMHQAISRSVLWGNQCLDFKPDDGSKLFAILQGGTSIDDRLHHLEQIIDEPFDAIAIGGLSVGEPKKEMWNTVKNLTQHMPQNKPRYLMGVGTPEDLLQMIGYGIDMFDCVMPTRNARNGTAFTSKGKLHLRNAKYKTDKSPLDENCSCKTCRGYTKGYLRHLLTINEILGSHLMTVHNIAFYLNLMKNARDAIQNANFDVFKDSCFKKWNIDEDSILNGNTKEED